MTDNSPEPVPAETVQAGAKYYLTVGILLVFVIGLLAVLWVRERSSRLDAQSTAAAWEMRFNQLQGALPDLLAQQAGQSVSPVSRDDLPARAARLDDRPCTVLMLGAEAGRRFGFRPGDLILVAKPPTATAPQPAE